MSPNDLRGAPGSIPRSAVAATARAHVTALGRIPELLERFSVNSEPILASANLRREDLDDPERSASFADMDRLIGLCVRRTRCNHFGLLLGQHVNLQSFGIAGRLARHAPTVGAALRDLAAYFILHDNGGSVGVSIHEGSVTMSYGIHVPGIRHSDHVYDLSVTTMLNVMRQLCGADWRPDAVLLPRKRPPDIRPYRDWFAAPLHFDSILAGMVFEERCLSQPIADADPLLHTLLRENASLAMGRQDPLLHGDVRRTIRLLLLNQRCSREDVARSLGLHPRTLGRRLQAAGATFQQLLDESRADLAQQLLRDTRITIARIAATLGYRDPTIFTRAFTRWTGRTPSAFRAALHGGSRAPP
jgi:AraC-like DNA-binding protein